MNPDEVFWKANQMGYTIDLSNRKNKKYKVLTPDDKWVHFGDKRYEDYTYHHNEERRNQFRKRNWKWATAKPYSPAFLSYWLLW